ncbi:MAG: DNA-3-methyladenine glycosylase I [Candidatus Promineifilaceae bacterium]
MQPPAQIEPKSLDDYLEVMSKAVFQSGMSWQVVDAKWPGTREAFQNFDVRKVADYQEPEIDKLAQDTRVIRNRRKLEAVVSNAQRMLEREKEFGSFQSYLRAHGDFDATVKALSKDFKFMGPTGCYYFLYVVGEEVPPHEEFEAAYRR